MTRGARWLVGAMVLLPAGSGRPPRPVPAETVTVFAAASLTEAFREIGAAYSRQHPGTEVRFSFAGSQQLEAQLELGAPADIFAAADERWMRRAAMRGLLEGEPREFTRNQLVIIVPGTNPAGLDSPRDLARPGVALVVAAEAVPAGRYARLMLTRLGRAEGLGDSFPARVLANVVSSEENVKAVVAKVQLGEADAGIVYRSDVTPTVARAVRTIAIPRAANVTASYPMALLRESRSRAEAEAFMALVLSPAGQRILLRHGFSPVSGGPGG